MDIPINEKGQEQARAVGQGLLKVLPEGGADAVLASTIMRGAMTGQIIAEELEADFIEDYAFNELNYGQWVNQRIKDIQGDVTPESIKQAWGRGEVDVQFPGQDLNGNNGESFRTVMRRLTEGLARNAGKGQHLILATHCQIIEAFLVYIGALSYTDAAARGQNKNCTVSVVKYNRRTGGMQVQGEIFRDITPTVSRVPSNSAPKVMSGL